MSKSKQNREEIVRLSLVFSLVVLAGLVLVSRLFFVQIVQGEEYSNQALDQYIYPAKSLVDRGDIYLSSRDDSSLPVATIRRTHTAYINPNLIQDPEKAFAALSDILNIEREPFLQKAQKENDPYEALETELDKEVAQEINELDIPGVATHDDPTRRYPMKSLAARVIGFMSYNGNVYTGTHGIERSMNETLAGPGNRQSINIFAEVLSGLGVSESETAGDVVLTIDASVQLYLEKQLKELTETLSSRQSGAIIMDPQTGEVVAMASYPAFDLNEYGSTESSLFRNPNVEDVYEMGSIIKPLTVASGIDNGSITPRTQYYDAGTIDLDGYTISNYDGRGRGTVNMQEVLEQSLNTGVAFIAERMGHEAFRSYFESLFENKTGILLPSEAENLTSNLDSPREVEYATAAFGQGLAISPISAARALSALGNGGLLVQPHIIKEIRYDDGSVVTPERDSAKRIFSEDTSETISRMLVEVYDEALLGGSVKIDTHSIAAKTGTAQIPDSVNGGYLENEFLHSFFGYFPAYDPEFLILFYTENPRGVRYASQSLTSPFVDVTNFLIDYYNVPPDR